MTSDVESNRLADTSGPIRRVFVTVLDGVGAGELPDAANYGDSGSNTLANTARAVRGLHLPHMAKLGLGNIIPIDGVPADTDAIGCWGKMIEASPGKDTITGHWEMAGVTLDKPFPTYPNGFPADVIASVQAAIGVRVIGNVPASGTEIITLLGEEHVRTGRPIVYTSADSVFQIAMHEDLIPIERQYEICEIVRGILVGENEVGRVICRPFVGNATEGFRRTERRKDYPVTPPPTMLDSMVEAGFTVHAIGKIFEIFNGRSITSWDHTTNNAAHTAALKAAVEESNAHLVFANLEDFDMLYGHRNNPQGMADALETWDQALPDILSALRPGDLFIVTADHGNDPTTPSTDHSREYPFLLAYGPGLRSGVSLGVRQTFRDVAATVLECFDLPASFSATSFLDMLRPKILL